ncbi:hypothetical protein [Novosphingobium sp.]|uniref:hypothetical protein n=2 Tax=Novosphingobium sp. TaxID=1874826 RepID=UPI003B52EE21
MDVISNAWMILASVIVATPPQMAVADAVPACTAPGTLPAGMADWATPEAIKAAATADDLEMANLLPGQAVKVRFAQTPAVTYPLRPAKPGGSVSYGGLLRLTVAAKGSYRVALDAPAWIDLVGESNAAVDSFAHGHGPACTTVRKMVDFALEPGVYTLEISANASPDGEVMVMRIP